MLIKELDLAIVDSLGDFFSDLVRATSLNHVQAGPAVLGLCAGGSTDKQVVLQLSLEVVLLDMVCESNGSHPELRLTFCPQHLICVTYLG